MTAYSCGASWKRLSADGAFFVGEALLHSLVLRASTYPATLVLYDGQDTTSGRLISTIVPPAGESYVVKFDVPLRIETGLYANFTDNMTECLASWSELADT